MTSTMARMFSRRQFLQLSASGLVVPTLFPGATQSDTFRIAVIADIVVEPHHAENADSPAIVRSTLNRRAGSGRPTARLTASRISSRVCALS